MTDFKTKVEHKLRDTLLTYAKNEIKDDRVEAFADDIQHTPHVVIDDLLNIIDYLETELEKVSDTDLDLNFNNTFDVKVNGVMLPFNEMSDIREYFEACCYAERLQNEFDIEKKESIDLGYQVRERIADHLGKYEDDIIKEIAETTLDAQMQKDIKEICEKALQLRSDYGDKAIEKLKDMLPFNEINVKEK